MTFAIYQANYLIWNINVDISIFIESNDENENPSRMLSGKFTRNNAYISSASHRRNQYCSMWRETAKSKTDK